MIGGLMKVSQERALLNIYTVLSAQVDFGVDISNKSLAYQVIKFYWFAEVKMITLFSNVNLFLSKTMSKCTDIETSTNLYWVWDLNDWLEGVEYRKSEIMLWMFFNCRQYLSSLLLDPAKIYPEPERLPQRLLEKCAAVSVKPEAIAELIKSMQCQ